MCECIFKDTDDSKNQTVLRKVRIYQYAVIYLGVNPDAVDFLKSGISISVSRKWPKWLVPICISKPSSVFNSGHAIIPIFDRYIYKNIHTSAFKKEKEMADLIWESTTCIVD